MELMYNIYQNLSPPSRRVAGCSTPSLGDDGGQYTQRGRCHLECGAADPGTTGASGATIAWNPPTTLGSGATHPRGGPVLRQREASLDHQE
jgi:hypothetical protein